MNNNSPRAGDQPIAKGDTMTARMAVARVHRPCDDATDAEDAKVADASATRGTSPAARHAESWLAEELPRVLADPLYACAEGQAVIRTLEYLTDRLAATPEDDLVTLIAIHEEIESCTERGLLLQRCCEAAADPTDRRAHRK